MPKVTSAEEEILQQREIAKYLIRLHDAQTGFAGFVRLIHPEWESPDFHLELIDALDKLEKGTLGVDNILITMPPRHSKSAISTVLFPPYFIARDPSRSVMSCSYNATLATDFGRQVRDLVENKAVHQAFPNFELSTVSRAVDVWRTMENGAYFAVGIGGTTSGRPANLLIVDDPIKAREDAESLSQRNKVWDYYTSALTLRLQPDASGNRPKQIIILTRWHPDDLAGRIMQTQDWKDGLWKHINFPAIVQRPTGRKVSRRDLPQDHPEYLSKDDYRNTRQRHRFIDVMEEAPLWPERFPLDVLKRRRELNPREFAALYMQEPYVKGGNLIKNEWWRYYPEDLNPEEFVSLVIAVDTAFKKSEQADYSVAVVAGIDRLGDIYIVDVMRGKYEFPELKQRLIRLNNYWRGRGLRAMYIEDKASGQSMVQEFRRDSGIAIIPYKVTQDKVAKINNILPILEGGRVLIPRQSPWLDNFMDEMVSFPGGTHDDIVDATFMAIDILSRTCVSPETWATHTNTNLSLNKTQNAFGGSLSSQVGNKTKWKGWGC